MRLGPPVVPGSPCVVVAEVGINHNGDLDLARRGIDAAAEAGADVVKFQSYRTEDFISDRRLSYEYVSQGKTVVESQFDMFKRCELRPESLRELKAHCDRRGIAFQSTPTSEKGVRDLVALGVSTLKNGSDFLTHLPLIRAMGRTGLRTVISTGMATLGEIDEAVRAFRDTGNEKLVLLHCTSSYPTPAEDVNLRRIPALAAIFGCPVGFSDHTVGIAAAVGAVALGAGCVEKHFTVDRELPGPDQSFSADPGELRGLVEAVRSLERALGDSRIGPTAGEAVSRRDYRLSCVTARALPARHALAEVDVEFRRPGTGLPPGQAPLLFGRRLKRALEAGEVIRPEDLE